MSIQAIAAAFETALTGIDRLVLLALANHCHKMTDTLFPSVGLLAWEAGVSKRTCQRVLADFREQGFIVQVKAATNIQPAVYRLDMRRIPLQEPYRAAETHVRQTPPQQSNRDDRAASADMPGRPSRDDAAQTPKPSNQENQESPLPPIGGESELFQNEAIPEESESERLKRHFEVFWAYYPKRDGSQPKKPAFKCFVALIAKHDFNDIMEGLYRDVRGWTAASKIGTAYIPMATTWLRQERWIGKEGNIVRRVELTPAQAREIRNFSQLDGVLREHGLPMGAPGAGRREFCLRNGINPFLLQG